MAVHLVTVYGPQRDRGSLDSSPRSDDGRAERRDAKLLHDVGNQATAKDPADRPSAWVLLGRLQVTPDPACGIRGTQKTTPSSFHV